jgi:hypothetical protein
MDLSTPNADESLEREIDHALRVLIAVQDRAGKIRAARAMVALIKRRSPQVIEAMERARGLS